MLKRILFVFTIFTLYFYNINFAMVNPASENCTNNGGILEIREDSEGQYGVCIFNDGSECEEWDYFRGNCNKGDSIPELSTYDKFLIDNVLVVYFESREDETDYYKLNIISKITKKLLQKLEMYSGENMRDSDYYNKRILLYISNKLNDITKNILADFNKNFEYSFAKLNILENNFNFQKYKGGLTEKDLEILQEEYQNFNNSIEVLFPTEKYYLVFKNINSGLKIDNSFDQEDKSIIKAYYQFFYNKYIENLSNIEINQKFSEIDNVINNLTGTYKGVDYSIKNINDTISQTSSNNELNEKWNLRYEIYGNLQENLKEYITLQNDLANKLGFENYFDFYLDYLGYDLDSYDSFMNKFSDLIIPIFNYYDENFYENYLTNKYSISKDELSLLHFWAGNEYTELTGAYYSNYFTGNIIEHNKKYLESLGFDFSSVDYKELDEPFGTAWFYDEENGLKFIMGNNNFTESLRYIVNYGLIDGFYLKNIDKNLPYILRNQAYPHSNHYGRVISSLFGQLASNAFRLKDMGILKDYNQEQFETINNNMSYISKSNLLHKFRKRLIGYYFAKSIYQNPNQDFSQLWIDLNRKYFKSIETKNLDNYGNSWMFNYDIKDGILKSLYILRESWVEQINDYVTNRLLNKGINQNGNYYGEKEFGKWLKEDLFAKGNALSWDELMKELLNEKADPTDFVNSFYYWKK